MFNIVSFEVCNIWISTNLHFISLLWSSWLLDFCCHLGRVWVGGKNVQQLQSITIIELPLSHAQTSAAEWSGEQDSIQLKSQQLHEKNIWMCANVPANIPKGCWLWKETIPSQTAHEEFDELLVEIKRFKFQTDAEKKDTNSGKNLLNNYNNC